MNILIIDDERMAIDDFRRVLMKVVPDAATEDADNVEDGLKLYQEKDWDFVFLDINMPGMNGIEVVKKMHEMKKDVYIVMVTAYPQYALDAFRVYANGYILKPAMEEDVADAIDHGKEFLSKNKKDSDLYVQCFGNFEVYYKGQPLKFGRRQSKEMFAYLIDRMGATATSGEICAILWEDDLSDPDHQRNYFTKISGELRKVIGGVGKEDVLVFSHNAYAVRFDKIQSDLYQALSGEAEAISKYQGEYMNQYSWAEERVPILDRKFLDE